jgi:hypothetical protein
MRCNCILRFCKTVSRGLSPGVLKRYRGYTNWANAF